MEIIKHNGTIVGQINNTDTTESTSTSTGSAIFDGGLAIKKNCYIGGNCVADSLTLTKGLVTQITSQTTPVTINAKAGIITTVSLTISNHSSETFTVTNSEVLTGSLILASVNDYGGANNLTIGCDNVASGSFDIIMTNSGGGPLNAVAKLSFLIL